MSIAKALNIPEEKLFGKLNVCGNCKWYCEFEGVCVNADSKYVADFRDSDFSCEKFESA